MENHLYTIWWQRDAFSMVSDTEREWQQSQRSKFLILLIANGRDISGYHLVVTRNRCSRNRIGLAMEITNVMPALFYGSSRMGRYHLKSVMKICLCPGYWKIYFSWLSLQCFSVSFLHSLHWSQITNFIFFSSWLACGPHFRESDKFTTDLIAFVMNSYNLKFSKFTTLIKRLCLCTFLAGICKIVFLKDYSSDCLIYSIKKSWLTPVLHYTFLFKIMILKLWNEMMFGE